MSQLNWEGLAPGIRCVRVEGFSLSDCRRTWDAIQASRGSENFLQQSAKRRTYALTAELERGARTFVVKQFLGEGLSAKLKNLVRERPARRSWRAALTAMGRNIPTAPPLALIEDSRDSSAYFVMEHLSEWHGLGQILKREFAGPQTPERARRIAGMLAALAAAARDFHDTGAYQGDFLAKNIFVREDRGAWLVAFIDLDAAIFRRKISLARRVRSLGRLDASLLAFLSRTERLRLLRGYAQGDQALLARKTVEKILAVSKARALGRA